jgi:integrase
LAAWNWGVDYVEGFSQGTIYFTGARRSEVFRLTWEDVDLVAGKIRLKDHKAGGGAERVRWLVMHPELIKALSWWYDARPCRVDNVFMQLHNDGAMGQPYRQRLHFMNTICARAGVKPFGFHAIRHKSAAITFVASGLSAAQVLMGRSRATTTDIYVRSAGLYADHGAILDALSKSGIGKAVSGLLEKEMPLEDSAQETFCTQGHVHSMLQ